MINIDKTKHKTISIRMMTTVSMMLLLPSLCISQINLKVGYSANFLDAGTNNTILKLANEKAVAMGLDLFSSFSDLNTLHGVNIGMRYLLGNNNAIELSYESMGRKRELLARSDNDAVRQTELFYSFKQYMIGYQSIFGQYGFGTAIAYNRFNIKEEFQDRKRAFLSQGQWVARFNLALYYKSNDAVSLSIQPYVQIAIQSIDLTDLSTYLKVATLSDSNEKFSNFGLSVIIYNGRQ